MKKFLPWLLIMLITLVFFSLYHQERDRRIRLTKMNRQLVQDYNSLRQKDQLLSQGISQITSHQEVVQQLSGTFMDDKKYYRINWKNYIHISTNAYQTGFFGGISHLEVSVDNQTQFPLDNVMIRLQYLKANQNVFKTAILQIGNIPSKTVRSVPAPDSPRGVSVQLQLERITSQSMNFCWTRNAPVAVGNPDPFQCIPQAVK
ncbi:MAG: hypothetical protein ACYCOO_04880 [Chitinophagaceae bacterium]